MSDTINMGRVITIAVVACAAIPIYAQVDGNDPGLQAMIDANAGGTVLVPSGDHFIERPLRISSDGTRLTGGGMIIQRNPDAPILVIEGAQDVLVRDLTLTRAEDAQDATNSAILIMDCARITVDGVNVINSKARDAAIQIRDSAHVTIRDCTVRNYKRIAVDDRTDSELYGYAFRCIDGTGILSTRSTHVSLVSNRIIEESLMPTKQSKEEYGLGALVPGRNPDATAGELGKNVVAAGYATNWHQGSAIVVTGPEQSRYNTVRGNHIVNAAQGIDLHCDFTVVSNNVIDHCFIGLKATHGCQGLVMSGNIISHADLWGIILNPGAGSYAGTDEKPPNVDAGITISNNIITHFGYGHEYWNWGGGYAIALYDGQLAENPPLRDVTLTGNIVYDAGRDLGEPPRYRYAVFVGSWHGAPEDSPNLAEGISFAGNRFHPGTMGIANVSLDNPENKEE